MAEVADVAVVGAGPSGCAAAIECARRGLRVVVVERARFPRDRPGESLPPGIETLLGQLDAAEVLHRPGILRYPGVWVDWGHEARFESFGGDADGPWRGFHVARRELDAALADRARGAGADVRQPCRALAPLRRAGRIAGVATSDGALEASWVIDAGGGGHWLARRVGLAREQASPRLLARFGYVAGTGSRAEATPVIAGDDTGWTWSTRVAARRWHWTRIAVAGAGAPDDVPPPAYAGLAPLGPSRGADVTWRRVPEAAGPGYFCVGDALAVLDPASGHGVLRALMAGMLAAHLIGRTRAGDCSEIEAATIYRRWSRSWFGADVRALKQFYRALPHPPAWAID